MIERKELPTTHTESSVQRSASQSIEWYADGQLRMVEADGIQITIRLVGRKGRRARIAVTAPPGAVFRSVDLNGTDSFGSR
jgi:hypothetical protein